MNDITTRERRYVPHARTGEPVPVLFPEEQAAQRAEQESNAKVLVSGARCHCGASFKIKPVWLRSGDQLSAVCGKGHVCVFRFLPEAVS